MCIIYSDNLQKIVAVWQTLKVHNPFDEDEVSSLTGLPIPYIRKNVSILLGNSIVYVDGKVNQYALQFIRTRIVKMIKGGKK